MKEEIAGILEKFAEFLEITNPITYMLRWIGWVIIKGLAWLVDSLSNITDSILGLKTFYNNVGITSFVEMLFPLAGTLMGFSFLYTGYLIIFQKKVDREAIVVNMFLAFVVLALLGEGMEKSNRFTDDAIDALDVVEESSISQKIVKENMIDLAQFDRTSWKTTELKQPNRIPQDRILKINITQAIDKNFNLAGEAKMSDKGREVFDSRLEYDDLGNPKKVDLDNGWFTAFKEKYYRWDWNFWTIVVTLGITAFTMLNIAIKLAKLFFELTFNYVLVTIIAPADIHSGQKTKQVLQSILNTFLVTIMVFLSLKIYMIGTTFITDKLNGVAYIVALFAFSLAVIDGPNIVERLFGIDAGLKSGWSAIAGGYSLAKGAAVTTNGPASTLKGLTSEGKSAALKGISGVAGVAGMAQGLRPKGQSDSVSQSGHSPATKAQDTKQENRSPKGYIENKIGSEASEEIATGMQEVASSLEQEMEQKEQNQGKNNMPGLHQEMASKGFSSNRKQSATVNSPQSISSESPTKIDNGDIQKNEKFSDNHDSPIHSSDSFYQSNYPSVSSEMQKESNSVIPLQEKKNDRETQALGQIYSDKVQNNPSVKTVKRTYQIGQNTGESIRKNIARYRRDHQ
ncbi:pLS20_p028 family conjugation system transmembrane protein [Metabacillus dongyingensis]|uniref:pLS20_p028 family conjugation system transmembrane protein n=1 Tax=Metabacillus dongyingensis TaxID=2874282 RepID=UPI003B8D6F28